MKKRVFSTVLALLTAMMVPMSGLAASASYESTAALSNDAIARLADKEIIAQAEKEVQYLRELGLLGDGQGELQGIEVASAEAAYAGAAATIEYTIKYEKHEEVLAFNDFAENKITFEVRDDSRYIQNVVEIYDDAIILDGNEVVVTTSTVEPAAIDTGVVTPMSSDRWYQLACPYGMAGSYTKYVRTDRDSDITFAKALKDTAYSAAYTIINTLAKANLLINVFTSTLYSFLQSAAPTSMGLSYIDYQYWHSTCGNSAYISAYGAYVTKHIIDWYPRYNMQGTPKTSVEYEIYKIY